MGNLSGLNTINVELTSLCNKGDGSPGSGCWMCGRRKIERDYPELALKYGDMDFGLVESIAEQLPPSIVVQLHNNGEPLLYPRLGDAIRMFDRQITGLDTNGKLLVEKADEIVGNLDTLTISLIQDDHEADEQYLTVEKFMEIKGKKKPLVVFRVLGDVDHERYKIFDAIIVTRVLHSPMGSFKYKKNPTVPEIGICQDFLGHPAIDRYGDMSICVRFDPLRCGVLGNVKDHSIESLWNGPTRWGWLQYHLQGKRDMVPLCKSCEYWGVATGY